jgi:hypothetical protein
MTGNPAAGLEGPDITRSLPMLWNYLEPLIRLRLLRPPCRCKACTRARRIAEASLRPNAGRRRASAAAAAILLAASLLASLAGSPARAQQSSSFYDKGGNFSGSSIQHSQGAGNAGTSFYGSNGQFSGSSITHGNTRSFYDKNGHYQGSTINTSPKR